MNSINRGDVHKRRSPRNGYLDNNSMAVWEAAESAAWSPDLNSSGAGGALRGRCARVAASRRGGAQSAERRRALPGPPERRDLAQPPSHPSSASAERIVAIPRHGSSTQPHAARLLTISYNCRLYFTYISLLIWVYI